MHLPWMKVAWTLYYRRYEQRPAWGRSQTVANQLAALAAHGVVVKMQRAGRDQAEAQVVSKVALALPVVSGSQGRETPDG